MCTSPQSFDPMFILEVELLDQSISGKLKSLIITHCALQEQGTLIAFIS